MRQDIPRRGVGLQLACIRGPPYEVIMRMPVEPHGDLATLYGRRCRGRDLGISTDLAMALFPEVRGSNSVAAYCRNNPRGYLVLTDREHGILPDSALRYARQEARAQTIVLYMLAFNPFPLA